MKFLDYGTNMELGDSISFLPKEGTNIAYTDSLMVLLLSVLNDSLWSIYLRHGLWSLTI